MGRNSYKKKQFQDRFDKKYKFPFANKEDVEPEEHAGKNDKPEEELPEKEIVGEGFLVPPLVLRI